MKILLPACITVILCINSPVYAQSISADSLLNTTGETHYISGAFKSSRIIHEHSIEMIGAGDMDVRVLHRFGPLNDGIKEFFGLDNASMRMGFDFGIAPNLSAGIGRSTYRKEYDAFLKWRILQQSTGTKNMPLSLVLAGGTGVWTAEWFGNTKPSTADRFYYLLELLIGRKFSDHFSLQVTPIWLHQNMSPVTLLTTDHFATGLGGRLKLSKRTALTLDYHYVFTDKPDGYYNPLGIGVDIETGGHVFQLHLSNTVGLTERAFLTETSDQFFKGDIRFGFNLSRMFTLKKQR